MNNRNYRRIAVWAIGVLLLCLFWAPPKKGLAVAKDSKSVEKLEKLMMASSTKTIQYRKGKVKSASFAVWKKAKKLSLSAKKLSIKKKGWYSLLVTTRKGKQKVTTVYFSKKTYEIPCNTAVKQKAGYYYIVPKSNTAQAVEIQNASLQKGANASVWLRGDSACRSWKLESAGGSKFRLKNVNSGFYLSAAVGSAKAENAVQAGYSSKNKAQIFKAYAADAGYVYLRCLGNKKYLFVNGNNLEFAARKANKAWKFRMRTSTCPSSLVTIAEGTYPSAIEQGAAFTLEGTVNSRYTMKTLTICVVDSGKKTVLSKSVNPNSCFYDIKEIDAAITFGKLSAGKYNYCIIVKDATGKSLVWVNQPFTVTPQITTMGPKGTASNRTLSYNTGLVQAVGHQSAGNALEKKACASYALAYCNAILNNSAPSPRSYWLSSTDVNCVWSKGGYTCSASGYGSELAVLQAAYSQIVAGKPCILHVTGTTEQHWLCVIGYKNVSSIQMLSAANFIAIDPWDGAVITVSSKYKVKNTYRLGVKN